MKKSVNDYIKEYQTQLQKGSLPRAYQTLMNFVSELRIYLNHKYGKDYSLGQINAGHMDYSYFTFTPDSLKSKKLKIGIVLNHADMRFEICLVGQNKQVMQQYWQYLKDKKWKKYRLPAEPEDFITAAILVEEPDFNEKDALIKAIESNAVKFAKAIVSAIGD